MKDRSLETLLQQADASSDMPTTNAAPLAARVRLKAQRQHRHRVAGVGVSVAAIVFVATAALLHDPSVEPAPPPASPVVRDHTDSTADQIAALQAQIESLEKAVDSLSSRISSNRTALREAAAEQSRGSDEVFQVREEVERAAMPYVLRGDRMYNQLGLHDEAIEIYQRVIRFFPNTQSATVAKKRLADIEQAKTCGGRS